jgi:hypothetical protein
MSDERVCPEDLPRWTGLAIRDYLLAVGQGSPYDFYKCFKRVKPSASYKNIAYYFYLLKRAGLVKPVGTEPSSKDGFYKTLYVIVPGKESDLGWLHPQQLVYPDTRWGPRRYWKRRAKV